MVYSRRYPFAVPDAWKEDKMVAHQQAKEMKSDTNSLYMYL